MLQRCQPSVQAGRQRQTTICSATPALQSRRVALFSVGVLLPSSFVAAVPSVSARDDTNRNKEVDNDASPMIQAMLQRTEEKREQRRIDRLADYDRRNFGDYFSFDRSPEVMIRRGIKPETAAAITKWMEENKKPKKFMETST